MSRSSHSVAVPAVALAVQAACSPGPTSAPPTPEVPPATPILSWSWRTHQWVQPLVAAGPADPAPPPCDTLACVQALADAAARRGALDVAAAHHRRAFERAPDAAALTRWVDSLVAAGDLPGAHRALASIGRRDPLRPAAERHRAALASLPPAPPPSSAALAAAYAAEAAGHVDDAAARFVAALTPAADPHDLIHAAELLQRRGDVVAAARLWSAARVRLRERGALQPLVTAHSFTSALAWRGQRIAVSQSIRVTSPKWESDISAVTVHSLDPRIPARRLLVPWELPDSIALSDDGRTLVRAAPGGISAHDTTSGAEQWTTTDRYDRVAHPIAVIGAGPTLEILGGLHDAVILWNARGEEQGRFDLRPGHDRRPVDTTALALTPTRVAFGDRDGAIRVVARDGGSAWTGPVPPAPPSDPNWVLALQFVADERLISVHHDGAITTWDARTGASLHGVSGRCSEAELTTLSQLDDEPADREPPTDWQRSKCHVAFRASIAPDGRSVALAGWDNPIRVRDTRTGEPRAYLSDRYTWNHVLALTDGGALALVDESQRLATWRPGQVAVTPVTPGHPTGNGCWKIAAGRHLWDHCGGQSRVWDLVERRAIEPRRALDERLMALSDDGRTVALATADAIELRELASGKTLVRVPGQDGRVRHLDRRAWISGRRGGPPHVLVDLSSGTSVTLDLPPGEVFAALSQDGRWLLTRGEDERSPREVRDLTTGTVGAVVHTLAGEVHQAAFSPDGAWVVWLVGDDAGPPNIHAHALALADAAPRTRRLALGEGFPDNLAFAGDEAMLVFDGHLLRWDLATGRHRRDALPALSGSSRLQVLDPRRFIVEDLRAHHYYVIADGRPRLVANVLGLANGGYVALSPAGALDGSPDAAEHLLARQGQHLTARLYPGELLWDAMHVPGVVSRALAGEDVPPPLTRPGR